ncbi:hypothetical protein LJC57_00340 [Parabacteroides sp. OttesenSCG-928-G07]|nr:hypothetical protein [Parabacteroides sp. OttesenSCG-928-G07]
MDFEIDKQTRNDLEIFTASDSKRSLVNFFNKGVSVKSKEVLQSILMHPLSDKKPLTDRIETITFFYNHKHLVDFLQLDREKLDFIEYYLSWGAIPTRREQRLVTLKKSIRAFFVQDATNYIHTRGITCLVELLNNLQEFCRRIIDCNPNPYLREMVGKMQMALSVKEISQLLNKKQKGKMGPFERADNNYIFRYLRHEQIRYLLDRVYYLDVLIAVAHVAEEQSFCFPKLLPTSERVLKMTGLFHPYIDHPVTNDIHLSAGNNVIFLTGPNMAGKSTLLKSIGLAVYLAHIGFPVPASQMSFSLLSGMYTAINLADRLDLGYSHFFSEVQRVKFVAERLKEKPDMLIIFDELFRGTNVKDAYEGTSSIVSAFARTNASFHIVSTHIVEVAEVLQEANIQFLAMDTSRKDGIPVHSYKTKEGVSTERLGMHIIREEKILDVIAEIRHD